MLYYVDMLISLYVMLPYIGVNNITTTISDRCSSGISGLDENIEGGYPRNSLILVAGTPGAGKTIFGTEFLFDGLQKNEPSVYVSFAETKSQYFSNMKRFGMDLESYEKKGLFKYLDFTSVEESMSRQVIDLLIKTLSEFKTQRLVIDSLNALYHYVDPKESRTFLHSILGKLVKTFGMTCLLINEISLGDKKTRFGFEEFVVDGVIVLKHYSEQTTKHIMELIKMRGTKIERSFLEYSIDASSNGIHIISFPKSNSSTISNEKLSVGIFGLDEMLRGGIFKQSLTLIEGPEGIGKTTLCLQFLLHNANKGENALFISFEEPKNQIYRLLSGFAIDYKNLGDKFIVDSFQPEWLTPLQYYKIINDFIEKSHSTILALDSISALKHTMSPTDLRTLVRYIQLLCKEKHLTAIFTAMNTSEFQTGTAISSFSDNLIQMRYYENKNKLEKEILIRKTRGSDHEKRATYFEITGAGISVSP